MNKEKELASYAKGKLTEHQLKSWKFIINDNPQESIRARCYYDRKIISIEKFAVDRFKPETLQDLFLHELAHALTGYDACHVKAFKPICKQIGCKSINAVNDVMMFELTGFYKPTQKQFISTTYKHNNKD